MTTTTFLYAALISAGVLIVVLTGIWWYRRNRRTDAPVNPYIEGLTLLIDGNRTEAFHRLQQAVRSGVAPTDAYIRLGKLLRESGDAGKALQIHKSLTVKTNLSKREKAELVINIAQDYSQLGKPDQAVNVLEMAVRKNGIREPRVYFALARESHTVGDTERAFDYLRELKKAGAVTDADLALYLSKAAEKVGEDGNVKEARKLASRALKLDPDSAAALLTLGNLEEKAQNLSAAIDSWTRAAVLSAELAPAALGSLERSMFQAGNFSDMEKVYRDIIGSRPSDELATVGLASFYRKQGRSEEAVGILEGYLSDQPESVRSAMLLMSMYATSGDTESLERFLDENEVRFAPAGNRFGAGGSQDDIFDLLGSRYES